MVTSRLLAALSCGVLTAALNVSSAQASSSRQKATYVTFNRTVALPGVELFAGDYIFELPLPDTQLNVVRVMSADRRTILLTAFTSMVERPSAIEPGHQLVFYETPDGAAPVVKAWFPEDDDHGRLFVY